MNFLGRNSDHIGKMTVPAGRKEERVEPHVRPKGHARILGVYRLIVLRLSYPQVHQNFG